MKSLQKERAWKKGIAFFVFCMFFAVFPLCVQAQEKDSEVAIYGLDSSSQEKISIPAHLPQSYQITAGNGENVTYSIVSGNSVKVSDVGLVTPKYTYWKRYSGYSTSVPEGQDYDYYTLNSGDTKIAVKAAGGTYNVTVHVKDYAVTYCDGVMDAYLKENITGTMTDKEIMEIVARFPASYDYSASYSSAYSMILYGGGDCWASTGAIIQLCDKLGIKAWARNGNKDPGAGGGHMNALAEFNGTYYELEAGFSMPKGEDGYRPYSVKVRDSLFSYYVSSGNVTVYQYDGYEKTGVLEVPETIDGRTVTIIAGETFSGTKFSEIKLPGTLTGIGDYAFSGCKNLTSIEIPASVTSIGASVFAECENLTALSIANGNENYKIQDQAIYSKDGSTLVTCPVSGSVTIPSTVTKIEDYAFYYNKNIKSIVIPQSVAELGEGAFGNCSRLSSVTFEGNGITRIGRHCFRENGSLSVMRIPASVTSIGAFAFYNCYSLKYMYFYGDAPEFGETVNGAFYDQVFAQCNLNAYYVNGNDTWTQEVLVNHGGTAVWSVWDGTQESIEHAVLTLEQDNYTYMGTKIEPAVTLTMDGVVLVENKDYIVNYSDNLNAGTATVTAIGIGSYYGEVQLPFTIGKAEGNIRAYVKSGKIMEKDTTKMYYYGDISGECTYTSSNPSVATVDSEGNITGISAGTADITIDFAETDNYLAVTDTVKITVTHDMNGQIVDATVTNGCIKMKCSLCNQICYVTVPTNYAVSWSQDGRVYSSNCGSAYKVGEVLECECYDTSGADLDEMEIISQDNSVIRITENKYLNFIADGVASVVVRPKYHPAIGKTFTFYVGNAANKDEDSSEDDGRENSNQGSGGQNSAQGTKYYDKGTGITISISSSGKKEATLIAVDKKHAKGNLTVPNTLKVKGTAYKITVIGKNAFKNQKQLKKVVLGKNIKKIDESAFSGCEKLQTVTVGKNVTAIGNKAFYKCKKLQKITIPSKVNKIGSKAFYGCKGLKNITIQSKKLTNKNVGSNAFKGIYAKAVIKVPKSKFSAYKKLLRSKGAGSKMKVKK